MAFDGVFAFQGKDHITASQLGRIVEGVAGKGRYVLPTLNQMTAEMQTANKVRVGTGDLVMDGRVVTNEAAVDLTVESGTSGYKRNDLVVCRYTKNASTGVEKFAAEVVKGTPTTGTAADPKVTEGDISTGSASAVMPLWRIPLNGITPGAPVRIAPVASTLKSIGDSVSHEVGFQFIYGASFSDDFVAYRKRGFVVEMVWNFPQESTALWTAGTLPLGFRPAHSFQEPSVLANTNGFVTNNTAVVNVTDAGQVSFICGTSITGGRNIGHSVWMAA